MLILFDNENIKTSIHKNMLHLWLASINPTHKKYLELREECMQLENQIGCCTDILLKNTLENNLEKIEQLIQNIIHNN